LFFIFTLLVVESCLGLTLTSSGTDRDAIVTTSLARLWRAQQRTRPARALLLPVYRRFTEGRKTADLRNAKALLDTLCP
jgi:hypothetical protein